MTAELPCYNPCPTPGHPHGKADTEFRLKYLPGAIDIQSAYSSCPSPASITLLHKWARRLNLTSNGGCDDIHLSLIRIEVCERA